jgi:monoamine oxidase
MAAIDVLIIGGGATGLMAARELSKNDKRVTLLEARNRLGGRIHTLYDEPFMIPAEVGAEFVHGDLPITKNLFKEANIALQPVKGSAWQSKKNQLSPGGFDIPDWPEFKKKLSELEDDISINEFLFRHFSDERYQPLRASVRQYAAGYDTADPEKASAISLRDEWLGGDDDEQYRPINGYQQIIKYLAKECRKLGVSVNLSSIAKQVHWDDHTVTVVTENSHVYTARRLIVTVPLGVLQASRKDIASINFWPSIPDRMHAAKKLAMGAVIKILLQFSEPFWEWESVKEVAGDSLKDMSFLFSDTAIPTWWTQYPKKVPLLTGWIGGAAAAALKDESDKEILNHALSKLASIFRIHAASIKKMLTAWQVANWCADPFARGSYSYSVVGAKEYRDILLEPVKNTLLFAGEGLYSGAAMGTVEAALASGLDVTEKILLMD